VTIVTERVFELGSMSLGVRRVKIRTSVNKNLYLKYWAAGCLGNHFLGKGLKRKRVRK
jgi:hypothetical protein